MALGLEFRKDLNGCLEGPGFVLSTCTDWDNEFSQLFDYNMDFLIHGGEALEMNPQIYVDICVPFKSYELREDFFQKNLNNNYIDGGSHENNYADELRDMVLTGIEPYAEDPLSTQEIDDVVTEIKGTGLVQFTDSHYSIWRDFSKGDILFQSDEYRDKYKPTYYPVSGLTAKQLKNDYGFTNKDLEKLDQMEPWPECPENPSIQDFVGKYEDMYYFLLVKQEDYFHPSHRKFETDFEILKSKLDNKKV
mgnify:CR=1 FL=1